MKKEILKKLEDDLDLKRNLALLESYGILLKSTNDKIETSCQELRNLFSVKLRNSFAAVNPTLSFDIIKLFEFEVMTSKVGNQASPQLLNELIKDSFRFYNPDNVYEIRFRTGAAVVANSLLSRSFTEIGAQRIIDSINKAWQELAFLKMSPRSDPGRDWLFQIEFK